MKRTSRQRRRITRNGHSVGVGLCGHWRFDLYGPDGGLKQTVEQKNLITNDGLSFAVDWLLSGNFPTTLPDPISHIMIGTGSTAAAPTDTDLQSVIASEPIEEYTPGGTGVGTVSTLYSAGVGTGTIAEAGLATGETGAVTLFNRVVFSGVPKAAGDTLRVTFSLTLTNA